MKLVGARINNRSNIYYTIDTEAANQIGDELWLYMYKEMFSPIKTININIHQPIIINQTD